MARPVPRDRNVLLCTLGAIAVLVVTYLLVVRTGVGQELDEVAMEGRKATHLGMRRAAADILEIGTSTGLALGGVALVVAAWSWRGRRAAAVVAAALVASVGLSSALKAALPRDELLVPVWVGPGNSFPSGHSTVGGVLVLLAISVGPARRRGTVARLAVLVLVLQTLAVTSSGWHRPGDVLGGLALAVAIASPAGVVVARGWRASCVEREVAWYESARGAQVALAVAAALAATWYLSAWVAGRSQLARPGFGLHLGVGVGLSVLAAAAVVVQARLAERSDAGVGRGEVANVPSGPARGEE